MTLRSTTQKQEKSAFTPASTGLLQRKLTIGSSNDPLELEADRVADRVMAAPANSTISGASPRIQRFTGQTNGQANMEAPASVDRVLSSPGRPLDPELQQDMGQRFGHDFSRVRVHTGVEAARSARDMSASAYTVGHNIVFDSGKYESDTNRGRRLVAHELTHVLQQSKPNGTMVQRAIQPEDISVEMNGREFELSGPITLPNGTMLPQGTSVRIGSWVNAATTVWAWVPPLLSPIQVPKTLLRPVKPNSGMLNPYSTGLNAQANAVKKNEADLIGKKGAEKQRLEGLLVTRNRELNRKLIQETMYNRFDPIIVREVAAANIAHGFTGNQALNPNLLKSMIFQESEMGTSGAFMFLNDPIRNQFNLGQVIDSSALALWTMLQREQPTFIARFFLTNLNSDLEGAQLEKKVLEATKSLNPTQTNRLAQLKQLSSQNWETFIWGYKASGKTIGFQEAITTFFSTSTPAKNMDYEFWIHMMVLWLFEKKKPSKTWLETIKAYNGSGQRAEDYRKAIERRATDASTAATARRPFIPTR
jgi:Domain of unknown function (DUF4157)